MILETWESLIRKRKRKMAECSAGVSQQAAEVNVQNLKMILDSYLAVVQQANEDNQSDARAWAAFKLRVANNAATVDHALNVSMAIANQTGGTENQQSVTPVRTGTGDYLAAGAVPANRATDVAAAGVATANQAVADALATAVALFNQGIAALQAIVVASAGSAAGTKS